MGSKDCAPPPDLAPVAQANKEAVEAAKEIAAQELAFRQQVYNDAKPRIARLQQLAETIAQQQLGIAQAQEGRAQDMYERYKADYAPLERQALLDALGINDLSAAAQDAVIQQLVPAADRAKQQTVLDAIRQAQEARIRQAEQYAAAQTAASQAQAARQLARRGLDPSRLTAFSAALARNAALTRAQAMNQARQQAISQGIALRSGAASLGRGLPNVAGQTLGLGLQAGTGAVGAQQGAARAGLPMAEFAAKGYAAGQQAAALQQKGALGIGQLKADIYRTQASTYEDPLGTILGTGLGLWASGGFKLPF